MELIDNTTRLWGDDLKKELTAGSKLRIAAATFSIYAFEALQEELQGIEALEFIFTSDSFLKQTSHGKGKQRRQFFIPEPGSQSKIAGTEFEIKLRNKLTQKAIARECAEWIRRKVTFRARATQSEMQSFAAIDDRLNYVPISGFTTTDLGYEQGSAVSNIVMKQDEPSTTQAFLSVFEQTWKKPELLKDVTDEILEQIATVYAENSPARIYFFTLYNLFADYLEDISEDVLPNDRTGYQETKIWKSLYNFQRDAATGIINKLETFNGCILADSVGLGKTFTALAVIKYYELRNKSVLVLCPKKLAENWTNYNSRYRTNEFKEDRFNYDVLAHTDLSRDKGTTIGGIDLSLLEWGNFDLVVIDESHNFRNADYTEEKESRYQKLLNRVIRDGVKTKVLMLSATPVNNRFNDLRNQLQLAYEGDSEALSESLKISGSVEDVFRDAQRVFNEWSKLPVEERTTQRILSMLDFDFFELLDSVTIARSRRHIQKYYDTSAIGAFPERRLPISIREDLTDLPGALTFNEIFEQLQVLKLAVYTPLNYVFESRKAKYEDLYNLTSAEGNSQIGQAGREQGLQKLMTVNLLKRLESSIYAFTKTLTKLLDSVEELLRTLSDSGSTLNGLLDEFSTDKIDETDLDLSDSESASLESLQFGEKISIDLEDLDIERWQIDLWNDRETLKELLEEVRKITPEHDLKLQKLKKMLLEKAKSPFNPGNKKSLVFSAFADTANYLYCELGPELSAAGLESAVITGGNHGVESSFAKGLHFNEVMTLFSPVSKKRDEAMPGDERELDVLIGTDVISEGQNLQDCDYLVNYDIHWNPVRIIQRFGRIDRIGSKNATIQLVNFWPNLTLDEYINLKERVENRMVIADIAGTADDNVLRRENPDAQFRREQLKRLQNEVIELEDVRTGVSITDLGLNDFRMDLLSYLKGHDDLPRMLKGLHAVVPADEELGLVPGVIFVLRNIEADEKINYGNRLHPYYLVYVDEAGSVVADHTEAKHLLDLMRVACRDYSEPISSAVGTFNAATRDGIVMEKYSELLTDAIRSMIELDEEKDIDSLFSAGPTTALEQAISGIDDFELITFVAVVEVGGK